MKIYTEKAAQTDPPAELAAPSTVVDSSEQGLAVLEFANDSTLETIFINRNSAYTCSETHVSDTITGKSLLKSPIPTRQRYAQLPFNRPVRSSTKRVVSLPEKYADKQRLGEASQRVVSMPERLKPLSPCAVDSFSSPDTSTISVESNALVFTKPSRLHAYPRSDIPSTPSPPSSPESIMIIGNDSQVPRSLRRPECAYNQRYGDAGSWISWANSPPRPIPALHGPLSLPYARCPSGAEGTIIEGEDLSNMIWGLNIDEAQARSHGHTGSYQKDNTALLKMQKSPRLCASTLPDHGPIDLSQLAAPRTEQCVRETIRGTKFSTTSYHEGITRSGISYIKIGHRKTREMEPMQTQDWHRGLGLTWQDAIELPPPRQKIICQESECGTLKPSALPFVPSGSSVSHALPRVVVEPRFSDFAQNARRPAVAEQPVKVTSYLPTPPDSSSPLWSPYVSTPSTLETMSPQIALHGPSDDKQLLLSQVLSSSIAITDCMQDFGCWASEQLQSGANIRRSMMEKSISPATVTTSSDLVSSGILTDEKDLPTSQDLNKPSPSLVSNLPGLGVNRILQQSNGQGRPVSPEKRFRGISQQPRSIPLARLIQRRLSSVAEEDITTLIEDKTASPERPSGPLRMVPGPLTFRQTKIIEHDPGASTCQTIRRTPSPSPNDFDPQTCKEPNHGLMITVGLTDNTTKVIVKLPNTCTGSTIPSNTLNNEKENNKFTQLPAEPARIFAKKKLRSRRRRSSPSIQSSK